MAGTWLETHQEETEKRLLEEERAKLERVLRRHGYAPKVASKIVCFYTDGKKVR